MPSIPKVDLTRLEKLPDALALAFYAFTFLAFLLALTGSPGLAILLLVIGAGGHVVRAALEDLAAQRQAEDAEPEIEIRRAQPPARSARPEARQRKALR